MNDIYNNVIVYKGIVGKLIKDAEITNMCEKPTPLGVG